jgi:hypothetical protein
MCAQVFDEMPRRALPAVRDVLTTPRAPVAYVSDSLALDLCVYPVERILSYHREVLHTGVSQRAVADLRRVR